MAADTVETKGGSRIVGEITKIQSGLVTVKTDYAGEITIKQSLVTSIATDRPISVRAENGTRITGLIAQSGTGGLTIKSLTGTLDTSVAKISACWPADGEDPAVVALRYTWTYEASADINGAAGTQAQTGTAAIFRAKRTGPKDTFQYYLNYLRQETDGNLVAGQMKTGGRLRQQCDAADVVVRAGRGRL